MNNRTTGIGADTQISIGRYRYPPILASIGRYPIPDTGIGLTLATAEALRAKIEQKSTISHQRGHFDPKFQVQGVAPTNHFCTDS